MCHYNIYVENLLITQKKENKVKRVLIQDYMVYIRDEINNIQYLRHTKP